MVQLSVEFLPADKDTPDLIKIRSECDIYYPLRLIAKALNEFPPDMFR